VPADNDTELDGGENAVADALDTPNDGFKATTPDVLVSQVLANAEGGSGTVDPGGDFDHDILAEGSTILGARVADPNLDPVTRAAGIEAARSDKVTSTSAERDRKAEQAAVNK